MSRITIAAVAAAALGLAAAPALAQDASGVINIIGSVSPKCAVTGGSSIFAEDLGELSDNNGVLRSVAPLSHSFTVACSSANANVTVDAEALTTSGVAPVGYANRVDFTGEAVVQRAGMVNLTVTDLSSASGGTLAATNGYLANVADNVTISASSFATASAADKLVAGDYAGKVTVTISPI